MFIGNYFKFLTGSLGRVLLSGRTSFPLDMLEVDLEEVGGQGTAVVPAQGHALF